MKMSQHFTQLLRIRTAIEKAERDWIAPTVIANAQTALQELIDANHRLPAVVAFIEECWHSIEEFLRSRSTQSVVVSLAGADYRALTAAWSAFKDLEVSFLSVSSPRR